LIWEERNLGRYEHARAARAKKIHQPSNDIRMDLGDFLVDLGFSQIPGPSSVSWWIWEILDKYPALVLHYSEGAAAGCVFVYGGIFEDFLKIFEKN
jgi:hypothetical protein